MAMVRSNKPDPLRRQIMMQGKRLLQYQAQTDAKFGRYNIPTKDVEAETRRLIRVARTINPRQHLRGVSYGIPYLLGNTGQAEQIKRRKRIYIGPKASPFVIAHELGHLLPAEKGATRLEEEAKATRHALRILKAAGYKDSALRRMQAQGMAAYESYRIQYDPRAAYARIMRNPIPLLFPPQKRKRARHLYNLLRKGRAQKVAMLGKALA